MDVFPNLVPYEAQLNPISATNTPALSFWSRKRLPMLLQTSASECGLVCLAMIANYFGHQIDIPSMRRRFSVSLKGTTMRGLVHMAQALDLQARPLKVDLNKLDRVKLPAVLHWDMNHFVVLKSLTGTCAEIFDPAVGARTLSLDEFSKSFTGVVLEVVPGTGFNKKEEKLQFTLMSLIGNIKGLYRGLAQLLLLGLALQVVALVTPLYLQWIVDEALVSADHSLVTTLGIGFLLLIVVQFGIGAVRSWITTVLSINLNFQWLGNVFSHLLRLPLTYFEDRHLGDIVSRFGSVYSIQNALTTQIVEGIVDGLLVVFTLIAMFLYSPLLATVAGSAVMFYAMLRLTMYRATKNANAEMVIRAAKQQTIFLESVRGVQAVRLFCRTQERRVLWMNALAEQMNIEVRIAKLSITYHSANTLLFGIERVAIIWIAAFMVLDKTFTVGMLFAFISYKDQFSQRMASLIDKLFDMRMLRVQGERLADIVLTRPEEDETDFEIDTEQLSSSIEIRNLSFRYADGEADVLKDISLTIPAGQCIAISGPSGCGKTTLVKLLLGLLTPTAGEILVGGTNINSLGLTNYRQMTGSVMQDDLLFAGSIADNIAFFDTSANQSRIEECARLAAIEQEVNAMPMRYMTLVGDLGTGLSGGQKQRIILARALYRSPRILVLDEATSHLDLVNEMTINNAIDHLAMTRIIIAHRPDTIAMADRIILLDSGQIVVDQISAKVRKSA